ncbi:DUF397 domain-containing protein [Nocardia aurantia]|uniref:DUF397 domain-containing protein n=1 Tax=Nocardia aurantia TaxID=2585199 RepID=A0A7K0DTN8_9NOCA|nr:DUF397 domain-containing protein [Nocardia aurantia]MQY28897.1 hypothetical protein [Nocardia aurantia]
MSTTTEFAAARWRKSAHSQNNSACVEFAFAGDLVGIRDSKFARKQFDQLTEQPLIMLPASRWNEFIAAAIGDGSMPPQVRMNCHEDGGVTLVDDHGTTLTYTSKEWSAFVAGASENDFIVL